MQKDHYRVLFLGDIVGKPGRTVVRESLPSLIATYEPLFVIANGENSAGGVGITPEIASELLASKVDAITLGNHAFNKRDIYPYLDQGHPIVRPSNLPPMVPGKGLVKVTKDGIELAVLNLCGRVFMETYDDPFREADRLIAEAATQHILLDFHAEATSEKLAMGFHVDGRVSAMVGTHTHVVTADEQILHGGTAYITDVGMCGPLDSVLGMNKEIILYRFRTSMPSKFEVASTPGVVSAVLISIERESGRASHIERVRFGS